ncbi:T9SS type A sorting domain-containing protein [Portibacter marinus]|uniref:T9SS type A sorting domain-containing protein n=1 Tax=Portibacter marinus TaxID=2898660 RepID=UPI001F1AD71A|nr:T9SS type A sorting domain-containing protein [Portibacter marinus]
MRNFLLYIFFLTATISTTGQIVYSPNPIEVTANAATENIQTDFELKNEGSDTVYLAWKLEVVAQPGQWQYYVCDTENCYNFNQSESSDSRPNVIAPGESIIVMFHTLPSETEGEGTYNIEFFDLQYPDSLKVEVPITINTITSSTSNLFVKGLSIFPNPTTDFFRVNTGDLISNIDVVTVVGKKVASFKAEQGRFYDVSDLNTGVYYVRLIDRFGESIKVLKLKKY